MILKGDIMNKCNFCGQKAIHKAQNKYVMKEGYFCDNCKLRELKGRNWVFQDCPSCIHYNDIDICDKCRGDKYEIINGKSVDMVK